MKGLASSREADQHLSSYVDAVQSGAEIIITRRGVPVARLVRTEEPGRLTLDTNILVYAMDRDAGGLCHAQIAFFQRA